MGVYTDVEENTSPIAPARLFKAFALDADNLISKLAPHAVKHVEILEGNGGPGTIKKITFGEGNPLGYVKHRIDAIDHDNFTYNYSLIEGGILQGKLEKITHEAKLVPSPDGGSIVKVTTKHYTIGDSPIDEEQVKEGKEKAKGLFKLIEDYLQANPGAYN